MPAVSWDPQQYLRYADARSRPFFDLLAAVGAEDPRVVDRRPRRARVFVVAHR